MTVKEFLSNIEGISTVGIYDKDGNWFETEADAITILKYIDDKVLNVKVWIYDENAKTYEGKDYVAHRIKANIYIDREKVAE